MEIHQYIVQKKELYKLLITYIEDEKETQEYFSNLVSFLKTSKITEDKTDFRDFLSILSNICSNHHKHPKFQDNIIKLISNLEETIKQTFTKSQISQLFPHYKQIELFLYDKQIVAPEEYIAFHLSKTIKLIENIQREYYLFRIDECEENFFKFEGNSNFLRYIQNDSIEEFKNYLLEKNIDVNSTIMYFEENPFFKKGHMSNSLIQLSSFYGSFEIFKYLQSKNATLSSDLWIYAIHGNNFKIIELLDKKEILNDSDFAEKCLKEAIKCHHNSIAKYLLDNLIDNKIIQKDIEKNFKRNLISYSFHYINYTYIPTDFDSNKFIFYYLCKYNYYEIVKLYLKEKEINLNETIIYKFFFMLIKQTMFF